MDLNITEGTIPKISAGRTAEPNPFVGKFPTKEGKSMVVELASGTEDEKKLVNKVANQAQTAARDLTKTEEAPQGYTARVHREGFKKGNKEWTRLTIWSVDRVFRARADETAAPEATPTA